jgi:hypothetical protein
MSNTTEDTAEGSIDLNTLVKRLPADTVGQFEPVSGVMVLNIDSASYSASIQRWIDRETTLADRELINTINHETFHFMQTTLCGYMFNRAKRLFTEFNSDDQTIVTELDKAEADAKDLLALMEADAGDDPELLQRAHNAATISYYHNRINILNNYAPEAEHSLAAAMMPHFFSFRDELLHTENQTDEQGLSILGVIEGAAVVYTAHLMRDERNIIERIEADIQHLPELYGQAWRCAQAVVGENAVDLLLPAASIALCYERPNMAYHWVLQQLATLPLDTALERAAQLFEHDQSIPYAGAYLHTGWDLREMDNSYRLYDTVFEAWDCEDRNAFAFRLLSEPAALNQINKIPICLTLSDGFFSGQMPKDLAHAKIYIASLVLKVLSRRREEKDFQRFAVQWVQGVIGRLIR